MFPKATALSHILSKIFWFVLLPDYYTLNKKSDIYNIWESLAVAKYLSKKHETTPYTESRDIPYYNAKTICRSLDNISIFRKEQQ